MPKITHPLWHFDRKHSKGLSGVIGVDEAGRGPFAGPVVAAAVFLPIDFFESPSLKAETAGFNDSKQLKEEDREFFYNQITTWLQLGFLKCAWAEGSIEDIETKNILGATRHAMELSLNQLDLPLVPNGGTDPLFSKEWKGKVPPIVLVDGKPLKPFPYAHESVVKGDSLSLAIAAASIIAKVTRDKMMKALALEFPHYGFERNKGYGTKEHCDAILKHGPCKHHRMSFLKNLLAKEEEEPVQESMEF